MRESLDITLAGDHHEAEQFCAWLIQQGHYATIGRDDQNHIAGYEDDPEGRKSVLTRLWDDYCKSDME